MADSTLRQFCAGIVLVLAANLASPGLAAEARLVAPETPAAVANALRRTALSLEAAQAPDGTPQDILAAARADYARLVGALYARGYYGPEIHIRIDGREAADISPLSVPSRIGVLEIEVRSGKLFSFSQAAIGPLAPGTEVPAGFARGQPAESTAIRDAAQAGIDGWRAASHAKARVTGQQITADHPSARLAARLGLDPGPRVVFGDLALRGPSAVRPERLRAIAGLPMGEPFDPEELDRSAERLRRTGAFGSVRLIESETLGPGNRMDIALEVADQKPRRIGAGAELSSLEGLTLSGFWMHRNLLGGAERLRFDAEIGGIGGSDSGGQDYSLSVRFDKPAVIDADTGFYALGAAERLDEPDFREDTVRVGAGLTRVFSDRLSGEAGILLRYSDVTDDLGTRNLTHVMFPASLTWDARDDTLNPKDGLYLDLGVTPMAAVGGEAESGARIKADARAYHALGERLVLAGRLQFGSVLLASADGVPPAMLFYSGGGGTVRGQPYESLAVELPGGDRIGGRSFVGLSAEARFAVTEKIGVVAFADTGYVGPDSWIGSGDWHSGAGLGLRYDTGIGPIRLDIAAPVGGSTGEGVQIYIGIGQAF